MTTLDAMEVAPFYDKYDFLQGRATCNHLFRELFRKSEENEETEAPDLGLLINVLLVADATNLDGAKKEGMEYMIFKLKDSRALYGRAMFMEEHFEKLMPLLLAVDDDDLPYFMSKEEMQNPLFPALLVSRLKCCHHMQVVEAAIPSIRITGTDSEVDGVFTRNFEGDFERENLIEWEGEMLEFRVTRSMAV